MSLPHFLIEPFMISEDMTSFHVTAWYDGEHRTHCGSLTMYHDEYLAFVHRFFADDPIEVKIKDLNHTHEMMKMAINGPLKYFYPLLKKSLVEPING